MSTRPSRRPFWEGNTPQSNNAAQQTRAADLASWQRTKLGDEQAMADIYDSYAKPIYRTALYLLHDTAAAEDVVQDVLLQFWRNPDFFDPATASLGMWLTVVSQQNAIDRLRKTRAQKAKEDVTEVVRQCRATLGAAIPNQITDTVGAVPNAMSGNALVASTPSFSQGSTYFEVSRRSRKPLGTVKSSIRHGLKFIRDRQEAVAVAALELCEASAAGVSLLWSRRRTQSGKEQPIR